MAAAEIKEDINELIRLRRERFEQGKSVDYLMRLIRTLRGRDIIGFLSSHNIIPKYGFPVDVVSLRLSHQGPDAKRLQLERDLRIALSEYAPGSQVVAGGKLWTSRYLRRQPRKEWERFRYAICENCHVYLSGRFELTDKFKHCPVCGEAFGRTQGGMFLIPAYGFASSRGGAGQTGDAKPERTYSTRVFYPRQSEKEEKSLVLPCNGVFLKATTVSGGVLGIINDAGRAMFRICPICGYAVTGSESVPSSHQTPPLGAPCTGSLFASSLGHEFETDVIKLTFEGWADHRFSFWISLLYALLEGLSGALDVERQDVDGCLYSSDNEPNNRVLVLFDDVPGGQDTCSALPIPPKLCGGVCWRRPFTVWGGFAIAAAKVGIQVATGV